MRWHTPFAGLLCLTLALAVGATPPPQLIILEAAPNPQAGILTVVGVNLGGSATTVQLAGQSLAVQSASTTQIVATLPALASGSYLLSVARGPASVDKDTFPLTIGPGDGPSGPFARLDIDNQFQGNQTIAGFTSMSGGFSAATPSGVDSYQPNTSAFGVTHNSETGCNRAITANVVNQCAAAVVGNALGSSGGTGGAFESRGEGGVGLQGVHNNTTDPGVGVLGDAHSPNAIAGLFRGLGGGRILTGSGLGGDAFYIENDGTIRAPAFTDLAGNPIGGVSQIDTGSGLVGGPITSSGAIAVDFPLLDAQYARLYAVNTFSALQDLQGGLQVHGLTNNNVIHADNSDPGAFVIDALSTAVSGQPRGLNATTFAPGSTAVNGSAQPAIGGTGGFFDAYGEGGLGVGAWSQATTGGGTGLQAGTMSPDGVAGFFRNQADGLILIGANGTQEVFHVAGDGTVTAFDFISSSSLRYKTNVAELDGALEVVASLRPVRFDWKASGKRDIGLIAEEVAAVVPDAVAFDDQGAQGVDYSSLTALLIEAVQEQQEQIRELQRRLDERP